MKQNPLIIRINLLIITLLLTGSGLQAQLTADDYKHAREVNRQFSDKMLNGPIRPVWIGETNHFWYMVRTSQGNEYVLVDGDSGTKSAAFDPAKLADKLGKATGKEIEANKLLFWRITFSDDLKMVDFDYEGHTWTYEPKKNRLTKGEAVQSRRPPGGRNWSESRDELESRPVYSPDSSKVAFIQDHNVWVRDSDGRNSVKLSNDGTAGYYYSSYMHWSPDSKKLVATKFRPAVKHMIQYIESSPADQVQPKYSEMEYTKPGDELPHRVPTLFLVDEKKQFPVDDLLFNRQFSLGSFSWTKDSRALTFEYNQRGHQVYRVLELDASNGSVRTLIEETSPTFIHYSGKRYRYDINDGEQIIWASERDGWNHLYRYDGKSGSVINQITKGNWVVRNVLHVDEKNQSILFTASGKEPGIDPYLQHLYRVSFDGSGLTKLTEGDGNHQISMSPDNSLFIDTWSTVTNPPISVLRKVADGSTVLELEKADVSQLEEAGWRAPEVFVAKGRDGVTDIWGIIVRPLNFDPNKKYPVIEYIYAGPHDSHVPKNFSPTTGLQTYAELGFIVVQMDGMGTSNRGKAFHDVCYKNLGDAGFPDRILWIKAAAKKYPYMDTTRVGIYGTSAGGQNSTGAVLFHPDFYDVAVSSCGCHDNRMDKIWWNEQWMGYPIDESYEKSSNVVNAKNLKGKLFLIVGEMDKNVDPASTFQVVDALIKAGKDFELLVVPGMGHSGGGDYGDRRRMDFFVKHLLGVETPDWNKEE
ncbi:MAG: S9 family peptidase [Bacteroidales bacterium]|jgi:dipeptidyl aminopeptidase/acylaminoacyl peptidase|nr:S9 family peptidase [Bacteroidales bacterium]MDD3810802.1 DPP IV N-terminal domain-containing protein [Bacteroidales bacterium]MDD3872350.1 DPP IV N-terminal domain-containing protein [Bacteroidales bacterium]MDD4813666.1 DPP IV N-terminal domain-containing protein [Bacteroidales bacterium]NLO67041.1 prolyl oligopeptidase family serine peptidase [Bacteroidales bacterium]